MIKNLSSTGGSISPKTFVEHKTDVVIDHPKIKAMLVAVGI